MSLRKPQQTRLGADFIGDSIPLWPPDGSQEHGVRRLRARHIGVPDRGLVNVISGAADKPPFDFEMNDAFARQPSGDFLDFGHDLGAYAITGQNEKFEMRHVRLIHQ